MSRAVLFLSLSLFCVACGGAQVHGASDAPRAIDALRARAEASPDDASIARELAVAELTWDGGDAARARAAIDHAIALAPNDPELLFVSSIEHEQHGRIAEAFAAEVRAIDAARASSGPLAPAIGEILIGYASAREGDVPDWRAQIEALLTRVVDEPGQLGMPARLVAAAELARLVRRRGEPGAATRTTQRAGCIQAARVAGPFGPNPMLAFDRAAPAEGRGALAERYDLGPTREEAPTRALDSTGCGFDLAEGLDDELRGPGVWVLESMIDVSERGGHVLYVRTPNVFRVMIDGERVGGIDRRQVAGPDAVYLPIELEPGAHEIEIVIATRHPNPYVAIGLAARAEGFAPDRGVELPSGDGALARFVRVLLARTRGDAVGAREALRAMDARDPTATILIAQADVTSGDPFVPNEQGDDRARRLLAQALEKDPDAWYPRFRLAATEQGARESIRMLREVADRFPALASVQLEVADQLEERGRTAEADALIARAREHVPTSCTALSAELNALRRRGRAEEADDRVEELLACDTRSRARFTLFARQRRWDDATRELERLAPLIEPETLRGLRLDLAVATGDDATAHALREEIARENGRTFDEHYPLSGIDELVAAGQRARAIDALGRAIDRTPHRAGDLRRVRRALGGDDPLFRYRLDGAEAIRRFEASGRRYDGPSVLVLDYMVVRVHDDGSSEELVHQIYRVQSEEAIERLGQLSLPGYVLTLRSIKPDGRRLEPDAIRGLDHVEMPSLAVGDYVEYEFVRRRAPTANGGYRSGGWVFQNFSYPFDRSQLVLVAPRDLPMVIEPRGPVPAPVETSDGALRVLTWTVEESRPLVDEPRAAVSPERLPSLDFGVRAGWDAYFDGAVDGLMDADPRDPAAERLVHEILGELEHAPIEARAHRLHRWVLENIEDGGGGGLAPVQVFARAGDRNRVLRYLLALADLDAHIVIARSLGDRTPGELAREDVHSGAMVMVRRPDGPPIFTTVAQRGIPFGYVPPNLRGQEAVVLEPGHPRVTIADQGSSDLRDIRIDVVLARDGSARVTIEETFHGAGSFYWRQTLEEVPEPELARRFEEGYVAPTFGQAELVSLAIDGRDDPDAPLVFRYVADVPMLGRATNGAQLIAPIFRAGLAPTFASLPSRETTERILGNHLRVRLTLRGPGAPPSAPPDAAIEGPHGARATWRSTIEGNVLQAEQELVMAPMLVTPDEYAAFARFCRDVDRLEAREIRVPR